MNCSKYEEKNAGTWEAIADAYRKGFRQLEIRLMLADEQIKLKDSLLEQYRDAYQKCTCRRGEPIETVRTWDHEKQVWV